LDDVKNKTDNRILGNEIENEILDEQNFKEVKLFRDS
jgi:hypothetical protein